MACRAAAPKPWRPCSGWRRDMRLGCAARHPMVMASTVPCGGHGISTTMAIQWRLLIRMHQTSHWVWAWLPAFWLGGSLRPPATWSSSKQHGSVVWERPTMEIPGSRVTGPLQVLNWGMIIAASMRSTLQASMETNEVIFLSMDNLWRSTQSLYVTFPLHLFSLVKATEDYLRYHFYGADVTFEPAHEQSAIGAWVHYFLTIEDRDGQGSLASCIVVSLIALDVLHPCAYLWVGQSKQMSSEKAHRMSWLQACCSPSWWSRLIYKSVLNKTLATIVKWLGPTCFVVLTLLSLAACSHAPLAKHVLRHWGMVQENAVKTDELPTAKDGSSPAQRSEFSD
eukprot:Skav216211  [mRNA]  locus=scaffold238:203381:220573:- [translate_table: standard]